MYLTNTFKTNFSWFFVSLLLFVAVLPFSQAFVSISGGLILFASFFDEKITIKKGRIIGNRFLFSVISVFAVYLASFLIFFNAESSAYDLQKSLFFFVIPLAFMVGKPLNKVQIQLVLFVFLIAVFGSTLVAWFNWFFNAGSADFAVHKISLISHIRFSFQLILSFWLLFLFIGENKNSLNFRQISVLVLLDLYFLFFLFFQQSLTGIIAFVASVVFYLGYYLLKTNKNRRKILITFFAAMCMFPIIYLGVVIYSFYNIEEVNRENIVWTTSSGNKYSHDFENPTVENGRYVYLYVCNDELRAEWNKMSKINYDSTISTGYPLNSSLIRYMTSKGLKKDAEGVKSLSEKDIRNIEKGLTNIVFAKSKYSPHPRIYQTIWEYYMYSKTGNPNYQSFSQRLVFAKAAMSLIRENPWFGVGAGNWKTAFQKAFEKNNSKLDKELYASSHNQYLNYMVKFGIPGFILILFLLIFPVVKLKGYSDPLLLILLVFMFVANFSDSNFETHMGSSFFLFFYCLFLLNRNQKYLIMNWKGNF